MKKDDENELFHISEPWARRKFGSNKWQHISEIFPDLNILKENYLEYYVTKNGNHWFVLESWNNGWVERYWEAENLQALHDKVIPEIKQLVKEANAICQL